MPAGEVSVVPCSAFRPPLLEHVPSAERKDLLSLCLE